MLMKLKIKNLEIERTIGANVPDFPKYATQLINLANSNAQGTRPKVVGQLSDLIQEFDGNSLEEWAGWYGSKKPDAIEDAVAKIIPMVESFKKVIHLIDEDMIRNWVQDLVYTKTFIGLKFQEAILAKLSEKFQAPYILSSPTDEAKGIDGYINGKAVSIKPTTYHSKQLSENIEAAMVYYEKKKDGVTITIDENDFKG